MRKSILTMTSTVEILVVGGLWGLFGDIRLGTDVALQVAQRMMFFPFPGYRFAVATACRTTGSIGRNPRKS
jgi:hypothetical protein